MEAGWGDLERGRPGDGALSLVVGAWNGKPETPMRGAGRGGGAGVRLFEAESQVTDLAYRLHA